MRASPGGGARSGFMLVEASLTTAIMSVALLAMVSVLGLTLRANVQSESSSVSAYLSQRLLEEIRLRRWDERSAIPPDYTRRRSNIGIDVGETALDKRTFDDVDDFNGWRESPPSDPSMRVLPGFAEYASSVAVRYVDATSLAPSSPSTDFKKITVCSWRKGRKSVCLDTLFTNH